MARQYGNVVRNESRENARQDALTPSGRERGVKTPSRAQNAIKCLSVVPAKRLAGALDVAVRTVQKWASGEVPVPMDRVKDIQEASIPYFLDVDAIHRETERELIFNHGPRNGHSARGDM